MLRLFAVSKNGSTGNVMNILFFKPLRKFKGIKNTATLNFLNELNGLNFLFPSGKTILNGLK